MAIENKILKELLEGEFKGLLPRPKIKWASRGEYISYTDDTLGLRTYDGVDIAWVIEDVNRKEFYPVIYLNDGFEGMKIALRRNKEYLRDTLRHECLHLLLKRGDGDPVFEAEKKKRGLDEDPYLKI